MTRKKEKLKEKVDDSSERSGLHPKITLASEFGFCFHIIVIIIFVILAYLCPLYILIAILVIQRGMFWYFGGCIINSFERKLCGNKHYDFLKEFAYRMTGKEVESRTSKIMDIILFSSMALIAFIIFFYKKFSNKNQ
jgi:hypothetical protein